MDRGRATVERASGSPRRYARQARLAGVGAAGIERLRSATFAVPGHGLRAEVAARYLAGAGAGALLIADEATALDVVRLNGDVRVGVTGVTGATGVAGTADGPRDELAGTADAARPAIADPTARAALDGAWDALEQIRRALFPEAR